VVIAVGIAVTAHFAPDDGTVAPDQLTDLGVTEALIPSAHDRQAFVVADPLATPTGATPITRIR
jgi:hypothetical protein